MLSGYVCLAGAGPGDPGLFTRLGLAYLKRAGVILYDQLVPAELLLEARPDCELISVGKAGGKPSFQQEEINRLLVAKARSGKFVMRLKGGDPFLFGRGGEEVRALVAAGVPYFCVPGISAALSVPAAAGIPVTDRQLASGLVIGAGHRAVETPQRPYTQVILMSLTNLSEVTGQLLSQGYPEPTPVAVISRGTTPWQKVVSGTLATIHLKVVEQGLSPPALLVVGEVVKLAPTLEWRNNLPLQGRRIWWTRPGTDRDAPLLEDLQLLGARVVQLPTFTLEPFAQAAICGMLPQLREYPWIVLTSQRAVELLFQSMVAAGSDWRYFSNSRFAVVGEVTARALRSCGRCPELVADAASSSALGPALLDRLKPRERVALCQAETTLPYLTACLTEANVNYSEFKLYRLICPAYPREVVARLFADPVDLVVFTAPMAVTNYFRIWRTHGLDALKNSRYACLGKETAAQLERAGRQPWVIPARPQLEELVEAILVKWGVGKNVSGYSSAQVAANPGITQTVGRE